MPINEKPDDQIRLTDITRTAIIMAQGVPLVDVEASQPPQRSVIFVLENTDDRAKMASAAVMNNTAIPIRTYLENVEKLREIVNTHLIVSRGADKAATRSGKSIGRKV